MIKPPQITDMNLYTSIRRLEILSIIKDVLPATEQQIIARLRLTLGLAPWIAIEEIFVLRTEKLIVQGKGIFSIFNSTPKFESYVTDLSNMIQKYKTEHKAEGEFEIT